MDKIRQLLWKMGMVPNRTTLIGVGLCVTSCVAMIVFGILFALTHDTLFKILIVLTGAPAALLALGSSMSAQPWWFASRKERARIEKERATYLLRSWLHSTSSEKDTRQVEE